VRISLAASHPGFLRSGPFFGLPSLGPGAAVPRPPTHSSIPALLTALQNEWDALVLETFTLKQQYNSTRQELSYALYSQDAASRVIARLMRERDAARECVFFSRP
jgi:pre-mRNA-processing factor 19